MNPVKGIRVPKDLVERIQEIANKEKRTFSGQVLYLVEKGLEEEQSHGTND